MSEHEFIKFSRPFRGNHWDKIDSEQAFIRLNADDDAITSNGEWCRKLEEQVAKISGADYAVACSSCTQAMLVGLGASGAKGECWTQSFSWPSTPVSSSVGANEEVVQPPSPHAGYQIPMHITYRDIDPNKWCANDYKVSPKYGKLGFTMAVDTFGMQYSPESYLPIFYDRAHSLGVKFRQMGAVSFISFSRSKILTTNGEGGMMLTNLKRYVEALSNARDLMSRMPETNAIVGVHALRKLPELLQWKQDCYNKYKMAFPDFKFQDGEGNHQVIGMLMDSKKQRDEVFDMLKDEIEFKKYYEPLHLKNKQSPPLPTTEDVFNRILCLPSWYKVDIDYIIESIRGVLER